MTQRFIENLHGEAAFQGFEIKERLFRGESAYQTIEIVDTEAFGRVLVLDGIVQTTERDEFMYHEMLVHVPLFSCAAPSSVAIIGGGDGGSLREVLKHDIDRVDMIEIDAQVIEACKTHLPELNHHGEVFDDLRVNLIIEDAFEYLNQTEQRYDVVISDSTDPIGAASILFSRDFYTLCQSCLKPNGVFVAQDGVAFLQPDEPRETIRLLREIGMAATCYTTNVPSYYGGPMTLAYASNAKNIEQPDLATLARRVAASHAAFRHYNAESHLASFALPEWIRDLIESHS